MRDFYATLLNNSGHDFAGDVFHQQEEDVSTHGCGLNAKSDTVQSECRMLDHNKSCFKLIYIPLAAVEIVIGFLHFILIGYRRFCAYGH